MLWLEEHVNQDVQEVNLQIIKHLDVWIDALR